MGSCRRFGDGSPVNTYVIRLALLLLPLMAACAQSEPRATAPETELVVFAAASLRDVFTRLAVGFESGHPGVEIRFNFAGTQELRTQLEQGAAPDVFAAADEKHMRELVRAHRVREPVVFARNEPVVVVARDHAATAHTFADLPKLKRLVIGTPEVPIGRYTQQVFDRAGAKLGQAFRTSLEANVVSRELNVRQVLAKVTLGEADAGIVYRSDAMSATGGVSVVAIPPELNAIAIYPIAVVAGAKHPKLAAAWIALVRSPAGLEALARAGFTAP